MLQRANALKTPIHHNCQPGTEGFAFFHAGKPTKKLELRRCKKNKTPQTKQRGPLHNPLWTLRLETEPKPALPVGCEYHRAFVLHFLTDDFPKVAFSIRIHSRARFILLGKTGLNVNLHSKSDLPNTCALNIYKHHRHNLRQEAINWHSVPTCTCVLPLSHLLAKQVLHFSI